MTEYETKSKKLLPVLDDAKEVGAKVTMPAVTMKGMAEERMRTKLRYKASPAMKAKNKQGKEYM
jgi:hypothetical protein